METIYLIELTVYDPALPGIRTLRYCTGAGYVYDGNYYEPRIKHPGRFKRLLYSVDATQSPTTRGPSQASHGEVILANPDGALDLLLTYGFDGRTLMIKKALALGAALSSVVLLTACSMEQPTSTWDEVAIRIKDRQQELNVPLQPVKYGGSNNLPAGIDGTADIAGKPKPLAFGVVKNVTPVCVNTSRLIYQVHAGALASIPAVYDKGVALVAGAAYADQSALEANAPAPGEYRVWLGGGCFRLGSAPSGLVTADAIEAATAADRSAAKVLGRIAVQAPTIVAGDIAAADIAALHSANPAEVGYYASSETTVAAALDAVGGSIGAWYGFDAAGLLRCGRLEAPAGEAVAVITDPLSIERIPTGDEGRGLPVWKVNLGYDRNWTVQDATSLAGSAEFLDKRLWTQRVVPAGGWSTSAFGNGIFLLKDGTTGTSLLRSTDGENWSGLTAPDDYLSVSFANGWFFLLSDYITYRSLDGLSWEASSAISATAAPLGRNVVYGNGVHVFVWGIKSYVSTDAGLTWTEHSIGSGKSALTFGHGLFLATGGAAPDYAATSPDGITWTALTMPTTAPATTNWHLAAHGNGFFVVASSVAYGDVTKIAVSEDGVNWSAAALPKGSYAKHLLFSEGVFVLTFNNTTLTAISRDGLSWTYTNRVDKSSGGTLVAGYGAFYFFKGITPGGEWMNVYRVAMAQEVLAWCGNQYRTVTADDPDVKTVHLLARELNVDTLLVFPADAQDEADRLLALYSVDRDPLRLKVPADQVPADVLGKVLQLQVPRYGYDAGKLFVVIGMEEDHETGLIILDIWG